MIITDGFTKFRAIYEHLKNHLTKGEVLDCQKVVGDNNLVFIDFYLPHGCELLGLHGPTAIEIKERLISDTFVRLKFAYDELGLSQLILVLLNEKEAERLEKCTAQIATSRLQGRRIKFYTFDSFLMENESPGYISNLKKTLSLLEGKEAREALLKEIRNKIHYNSYTLFLGAGISCSAGLPSWDKLLKGILSRMLTQSDLTINVRDYSAIKKYPYCSNSSLIIAQYLCANLPKDGLSKIVREEIYKVTPQEFTLLDSLLDLVKNNRPESVITYNFDDLFETRAKIKGVNCRSIADDNRIDGEDLPVYHVHGVLRQHVSIDEEEHIVLDEKSYHIENKDAFLWSNIEQMHALRRSTCIFVGLSMTDPNLRRLLDISQRAYGDESTYHYAFLRKEALKPNEDKKNEENQVIIENILRGLGVTTVWYDNHNDLPSLIRRLI